jgi:hypothetical protein
MQRFQQHTSQQPNWPYSSAPRTHSNWPLRYITDLSGLRRYGACLHLLPRPPDVLIVDDLSELTAATRHALHAIMPLVLS